MRRTFGFLIGMLVGWMVGGTLSLLLAPESGQKLRDQLRSRSAGFTNEIKSAAETRRKHLESQLASMQAPRMASRHE